ncbi:MAG TPA: acetyl-CoA hydrolase/transferase C-terminal domain-containing protein [Flavobacteriaceae bacterium]|nr:acetyl-CoA hydrolase/transferase family protein [Flavobacteriaceae bacterium]MCB9212134.1 acetyl-CoA hydrolase/transferase family protein [Alteromonas sp.]HPF10487.1 acetyl-CoA hydrolase/transferase C-terminal domain-containing protein [Flavobacteriaceae bacterium]HQU21797.1 acetyl-CoA hydrolase/transferase C-terminal domain-containing protein [Flavobacteriaceae bacterium]HQU64698.1 acetyl-CoA hydrolase/transferase C-terminal domain-containing protein [Flavobacteriaceae bacterium]
MKTPLEIVSIEQAVGIVKSGDRVFFQGAAMTPNYLIDHLCERYNELENVEIVQIHTDGDAKYIQAPYNKAFKLYSFFVGANVRQGVNSNYGDYIPIFLSEIHWLFRRDILPLDVAFIQVSPPDKHGYCSLGVSVDITLPAIQKAKKVVALINPKVPRTHGDGIIHSSHIDYAVNHIQPIHASVAGEPSDIEHQIGKHVAGLIEDGATLQMGIGNIPNAVLHNLGNHKRLGIHTEMFSDGLLPLVEKGIITGEEKEIKTGKIVTTFAVGSQKLYDFVDDNPLVHFKEAGYTNDTSIIKRNPKVTAINSAIEIDITGQVCADTIGDYQYSGVGGQMDFIRGASLSHGGKPIIAIPSTTKKGQSKIVSHLKYGAGVTTTRAHVHYVATEYGVVNLFGKSLKQRAKELISIAHPDHQEQLEKEMFERLYRS